MIPILFGSMRRKESQRGDMILFILPNIGYSRARLAVIEAGKIQATKNNANHQISSLIPVLR